MEVKVIPVQPDAAECDYCDSVTFLDSVVEVYYEDDLEPGFCCLNCLPRCIEAGMITPGSNP